MTRDEAIKYAKENILAYTSEMAEFKALAIEAIEKQIPKSMDLEGDGCADGVMIYDIWICPRCGKHYELEYDDYDFCPNCGQALDWSEERGE